MTPPHVHTNGIHTNPLGNEGLWNHRSVLVFYILQNKAEDTKHISDGYAPPELRPCATCPAFTSTAFLNIRSNPYEVKSPISITFNEQRVIIILYFVDDVLARVPLEYVIMLLMCIGRSMLMEFYNKMLFLNYAIKW